MSWKRTNPDDPIVAKARDMRARGKSYAVIGRVLKKSQDWARFWTNEKHRADRNKDSIERWHERKAARQ